MPKNKPLSRLEWLKAVQQAEETNQPIPPSPGPQPTSEEREELIRVLTARLTAAKLSGPHQDFLDTGNPLYLLHGFVNARRAGVPVPEWVLQKFQVASEAVLTHKGTMTFDTALGLTPQKGERNKWTDLEQHLRDAQLKWKFDYQLKQNKLPLVSDKPGAPSAVKAVAEQLGLDDTSHDSLRRTYHKRIKKHSSRLSR